ncbi:hypothetical protein C0993_004414 [Termitomyces sp. T159_Od127]|nr:hypothetical protein C0993_004414 [Termitomyces sp. T159_Od127]
MAFKRVQTDELHDSLAASSAPKHSMLDDDIATRLRSIGSRVRKNVTEGYISAPPSFLKSNSTGTIFQSARDSLRVAQSLQPPVAHVSTNKRSQPPGESGYDSDGAIDEGRDAEMDSVNSEGGRPTNEVSSRPMKALRKPRKAMLQTRSLPSHSFALGGPKLANDVIMNKVEEEEDWSIGDFAQGSNPTFSKPECL